MFHDRIVAINGAELETGVLLQALEELYPIYCASRDFLLSRLIGKSVPLTSDEQKIAQLAETITKDFMLGYGVILREVSKPTVQWRIARSLPRVICRLMRGLSGILLLRYLLRIPEPEWLWLDFHGLYRLAEEKEKQRARVNEDKEGKTVTIETIYKQTVLLHLAEPRGLGHREILDVYENLEGWSESLSVLVKNPAAKPSGAILYMDEDRAPLLYNDHAPEEESDAGVYHMPLDHLLRNLSDWLVRTDASIGRFDLVNPDGNRLVLGPAALLEYLRDRWSAVKPAKHDLFEDRKPRIMSIGLKATHQQLNPPTNPEEKIMGDWLVTVNEDQSLRCEFDQPAQIYSGTLVSLKLVDLENARRVLGVIDKIWMKRLDGAVYFEVTVLAPQVLAAGIQPVKGKKEMQIYQRVLLFFSETAAGRKANLVLESRKLKNGQIVQLLTSDETMKVLLENRKNVAPGYWQFECVPLADEKTEVIPAKGYDFL